MPGDHWQKLANLRALYALHVGAPGQEAAVHGRRVRPGAGVEPRAQPRLAPAASDAGPRRRAALVRDLNRALPRRAGAVRARLRPAGVRVARRATTPTATCSPSCAARRDGGARRVRLQLHAGAARRTTASACRARAAGARCSTPTPSPTAARASATTAASTPRRSRGTARRYSAELTLPPLGVVWLVARSESDRVPWERPLGAVPVGDGTSRSGLGAARRARRGARRRREPRARPTAGTATTRASWPARRGDRLPLRARRRRRAARPGVALAAGGRARPVAASSTRRVRLDRRRLAARPLARPVLYELHVGTFTAEGTFDGGDRAPARAARAGRHGDRADAGRRVPRRAATGATTASTSAPRSDLRRARGLARGSSTPRTRAASRSCSTSSTTTSGPGVTALAALRPVLHRQARDALGPGDQLRRRATATRCASGRSRTPCTGSRDYHVDGLRLDAVHAIVDAERRRTSWPSSPRACTRSAAGARS